MKKRSLNGKLNLKKNTISNLDKDAIKGRGPETATCNCITRRKDCVIYEPTMDGCETFWCTEALCA
ncbi:class I lanthipeptide [Ascidiimonas sp. W6]|uniref:class I lanthipeptide n=1 Tax=Ascidiimonas meishanensis TaxID=3128903 RepID=UPI0030EB75D1